MEPCFTIQTLIQRPLEEVFDAVYDPTKLSAYFVGSSSGPLDEGSTVTWDFADFPGAFPVVVKKVVPNEKIVFEWGSSEGYNTTVEMVFKDLKTGSTLVQIAESGWKDTDRGRKSSYSNCFGWAQMSSAMKAYLEYGINLRKGAYRDEKGGCISMDESSGSQCC